MAATQSLSDHAEMMKFSQEILQLISGTLHQDASKCADTLEKIKTKVDKGKQSTRTTSNELHNKKMHLRENMEEPSIATLKQETKSLHSQIKEQEKQCKKLENEAKILEFHKKHRKLQKKVSKIHFDLSPSENQVKGYMTSNSAGVLQTFDFNLQEDSPCYISDFLWDSI